MICFVLRHMRYKTFYYFIVFLCFFIKPLQANLFIAWYFGK